MMFISYIIIFSIISGLVVTQPIEEKPTDEKLSTDQAFRKAEMTLNRYFYLMKTDTDQLVHALLLIIMNNPAAFPFVPRHALEIALKNFEDKLGHDQVEVLTKPILSSVGQYVPDTSNEISSSEVTDDVKDQIEDALDKFLEEHV